MSFHDALTYCGGLSLEGQTDWRLPNISELESIIDLTRCYPSIDTTYFPNISMISYWSSTTNANDTDVAWCVRFYDGYVSYHYKYNSYYVRCVRGGQ